MQNFLENAVLGQLFMEFLHGDGWALQCPCTRCERPWFDAGWACPVEHHLRMYVTSLRHLYFEEGYISVDFMYLDWDSAVRLLHEMLSGFIPLDRAALVQFAEVSCNQLDDELCALWPLDPP